MLDIFHAAAASVVGRHHLELGINNQDAVFLKATDDCIVGIVCDGCSGGNLTWTPDSEVGAKFQADVFGRQIMTELAKERPFRPDLVLEEARTKWVSVITDMARIMETPANVFVQRWLMATLIGVIVTPATTVIFRKGDGVYKVNGETPIMIDENNTPSYPAYALLPYYQGNLSIVVERVMDTRRVNGIILGSDGLEAFVKTPDHPAHGDRPLGPLEQFYDPIWMGGPGFIQKRLIGCGPWRGRFSQNNPLFDDTSLIRIQRRVIPDPLPEVPEEPTEPNLPEETVEAPTEQEES